VSVIILNYNGLRFVEQCVRSVLDSDYPKFDVILVDNGSTDGSYDLIRQSFSNTPNVRIVRNDQNLGFAQGNNVGYRYSTGDIVVFLNVDIVVEPEWLRELVHAIVSDDSVGGVQSKQMSLKNRNRVESVGAYMDRLGFVYPTAWWSSSPRGVEQRDEPFFPDGGAMAFPRTVLEEVALDGQPFDRDYFFYFEDNDLGWRLRLRKYSILCVPTSIVYHYRGGSASATSSYVRTFSFAKNRLMTLVKNYSLSSIIRYLPLVILLEIPRIVILLHESPARSLAKLQAYWWCLTNFREIWRKHELVQSRIRTVPDSEVVRHMLMTNFFALRRTTEYWK
jgi:hypothetical protein